MGTVAMSGRADLRIGFLGAGKMATALARGWIAAGLLAPERCRASDPVAAARQVFVAGTGGTAGSDNREVAEHSDLVVIAVKPQNMQVLFADVANAIQPRHLVVSIAAGVTLGQLAIAFGGD